MYIGPAGEAADIINNYQAGLTLTGTLEEDLKTLDDFFSDRDWNRKIQIMGQNGKKTVKRTLFKKETRERLYGNYGAGKGIIVSTISNAERIWNTVKYMTPRQWIYRLYYIARRPFKRKTKIRTTKIVITKIPYIYKKRGYPKLVFRRSRWYFKWRISYCIRTDYFI